MRPLRSLVLAVVALALLTGASRGPAAGTPRIPAVREQAGPLLGISLRERTSVLTRLDPRSLRPLRGGRVVLGKGVTAWGFAPGHSRLAVGRDVGGRGVLRLVAPTRLASLGRVVLGPGWPMKVAWLAPDRVAVLQVDGGSYELILVDAQTLRVLSRQRLPGDVVAAEHAAGRLALLLAPRGRIGAATLAVADANGSLGSAALTRTFAGADGTPDGDPTGPIPHHRTPGLAVDPEGRRAVVVGAGEPAAEVSLDSLAVSYHSLGKPGSLLSRLGRWLEPAAMAKGTDGPTRNARWLGNGLVAVAGEDEQIYDGASGRQMRWTPSGLQLLDTSTWSVRTLARNADSFARAGAGLLATGTRWDSGTGGKRTIGLAGYGSDGALSFRVLKQQGVGVELVYRGRAYVDAEWSGNVVVDAASGRIVGRRADDLPWVLLGDSG